jgi:hypothetical protein
VNKLSGERKNRQVVFRSNPLKTLAHPTGFEPVIPAPALKTYAKCQHNGNRFPHKELTQRLM